MADLNFQINVGGNAPEAIGSLKKQLREAQQEVAALSDKFGATSKEAAEAAKRAADLKDRIGDAKALVAAFNPDQKFTALSKSLGAVAGGFSAIQGAMGLFGSEGKELEKTMLKVQSALALSQGLEQLGDLGDAFKNLKAVAVNAFNGIKAAIGSTGIGLLVIALGAVYAYWDDIKAAVSGVSEEQKKLNKQTQENYNIQKEKLDAIGQQDNILKLQGKSEKEILKIKIAQTDEAIKAAELVLANAEVQKETQIAAAKRNKAILEGLLAFVSLPITGILKMIDLAGQAVGKNFGLYKQYAGSIASFVFDPEQTRLEGEATVKEAKKKLLDLKNSRAGYELAIQGIDKAASDKARQGREQDAKEIEQQRQKDLEAEQKKRDQVLELDDQIRKARQKTEKVTLSERDKRIADARQELEDNLRKYKDNLDARQKARILYDERIREIDAITKKEKEDKEKEDKEKFNANLVERGKAQIAAVLGEVKAKQDAAKADDELRKAKKEAEINSATDTLNILSGLIDKNSAAGKAIAVSQAIINTYQGASKALAQGGILGPVAAAATIAAGLINVKKIIATKIPSANGSGDVGGGSAPSISSAAPMGPQIPQTATTNISAQSINALGNQAIKAYVVETDVTTNQQRIKAIQQRARFE